MRRSSLEEIMNDPKLSYEEKIQKILEIMIGAEKVDSWLDEPHPDLGNRTPRSVIGEGKTRAVYEMLADAINGTPG